MTLRILFDQNIPPVVCEFVRKRKPHWEVRHLNDVGRQGATDDTIFQWAQSDLSIVITFDEDFAFDPEPLCLRRIAYPASDRVCTDDEPRQGTAASVSEATVPVVE